jgi:hypothetical protein
MLDSFALTIALRVYLLTIIAIKYPTIITIKAMIILPTVIPRYGIFVDNISIISSIVIFTPPKDLAREIR